MTTNAPNLLTGRAGWREWWGLAALALPTLLLSVDLSVVYLALPTMAVDLALDGVEQLWFLDIYGFLLAGFLVTMGTLGDRIGHRRLLLIGAGAFGLASVLAATATDATMLIAARAALGVAGAALAPTTLALITRMFKQPRQRGIAIAVWSGCFMGGSVLGPVAGGSQPAIDPAGPSMVDVESAAAGPRGRGLCPEPDLGQRFESVGRCDDRDGVGAVVEDELGAAGGGQSDRGA